jgi:HD-GYP domain-containing protein (c-di-GMP phosphodiesterase class II)
MRIPPQGYPREDRSVKGSPGRADTRAEMQLRTSTLDPCSEGLVETGRERQTHALTGRDRAVTWALAAGFLAVAGPLALLADSDRAPEPWTLALLVLAYALASRIQFEVASGSAVPTQLVLVPMLFLAPVATVPLLVALGYSLGLLVDIAAGRVHAERVAVLVGNSWHSLGPALVLLAAGESQPSFGDWPIYLAALAAQFCLDLVSSTSREWLAVGVPPRALLAPLGWVFLVDSLLAPVGLLCALAAQSSPAAVALVLPLMLLLAIFARERAARIDGALELSHAYRGTAFLLGDVVEADDSYTGSHSRDVVELVLAVSDELGLDESERRRAEFTALLHDIGKIRIPNEIINKPGALDAEERALVETHTVQGERLLERVGGLLGEVGMLVRSCHERWDGNGYPDGLAGEEIPLVARIVCACDAFNAMRTDRSYRKALPLEVAIAEVERNAGTQFAPDVAGALVSVVQRQEQPGASAAPDAVPPPGEASGTVSLAA